MSHYYLLVQWAFNLAPVSFRWTDLPGHQSSGASSWCRQRHWPHVTYLIISVHRTASCSSISLSLYWFLSISTLAISTLVKRFLWAVGTSLCGGSTQSDVYEAEVCVSVSGMQLKSHEQKCLRLLRLCFCSSLPPTLSAPWKKKC